MGRVAARDALVAPLFESGRRAGDLGVGDRVRGEGDPRLVADQGTVRRRDLDLAAEYPVAVLEVETAGGGLIGLDGKAALRDAHAVERQRRILVIEVRRPGIEMDRLVPIELRGRLAGRGRVRRGARHQGRCETASARTCH
jgi:hypothetical protein